MEVKGFTDVTASVEIEFSAGAIQVRATTMFNNILLIFILQHFYATFSYTSEHNMHLTATIDIPSKEQCVIRPAKGTGTAAITGIAALGDFEGQLEIEVFLIQQQKVK